MQQHRKRQDSFPPLFPPRQGVGHACKNQRGRRGDEPPDFAGPALGPAGHTVRASARARGGARHGEQGPCHAPALRDIHVQVGGGGGLADGPAVGPRSRWLAGSVVRWQGGSYTAPSLLLRCASPARTALCVFMLERGSNRRL